MAKVELSALLNSLTGKISGSVFQTSVGGLQMRTRVSPRNPRSTLQQIRRAAWSFASLSWLTLLPPEIISWNLNAPPGETGVSFYLKQNAKIQVAGQPLLKTYTPDIDVAAFTTLIQTLQQIDFIIETNFAGVTLGADQYLNIFTTDQLSSGTTFISPTTYVYLKTLPPGSDIKNPFSIFTEYVNKYGAPIPGKVIGVKCYIINTAKGISSPDSFVQGYVVAA